MAIRVIGGVFAQVILVKPSEATIVNASILNVNSSDYWDNLDIPNATQMENSGGTLNILESWLTTFVNTFNYITATNVAYTNESNTFTLNQTFNQNISVSTGFFTNLGTAISRITKGWFTNLDVSNNLDVNQNVTASYFFGDGSQLTGIIGDNDSWNQSFANGLYNNVTDTNRSDVDIQNVISNQDAYLKNTGDTGTGDYTFDGAVIINEAGADKDFRVETLGAPNTLFVDGANGRVGIGKNNPTRELSVVGDISISRRIYHNDNEATYFSMDVNRPSIVANGQIMLDLLNSGGGQDTAVLGRVGQDIDVTIAGGSVGTFFEGSSGNVGINLLNPTEKLQVSGNFFLTTDNDKIKLGTGKDAEIYYDGTNLIFNTNATGSGNAWFSRGLSVSENATFNKNVIINKNLFVQGCIVYNMSGTSVTLGDCI
ncbi:hypothetical protein BMS3Abin17_00072 [archaeon BMS3Abin17]|nr:hypothetical protein BMS3Abin17_00072 [archaeon BMS3Abin17]